MSRSQLRLTLVLAGILPALVAVAFAGKVITMLSHDRDGRDRFDDAEYVAAADEFSANGTINWFESWITAFDEGAARHADDDLDEALALYAIALQDVPAEDECTVRINAALAHETLGDAALDAEEADEATAQWQAGIDVLAEGDCPTDAGRGQEQTDDAAAVDQRLRDKLQQQQQEQQQNPQNQQQDPQDQEEQRRRERQERELEERNDEGIDQQQEHEDDTRDRDYSQYQW